ncbi:vWA domain-containing protein [Corynebacterium urinipleomorphum]|uniref:vWA domain-containing protein n=1 Tax=Corynebacterium urinipleomorphum TaxID=1852380 RepID=UPI000B35C2CA|nr:vWA domain-containing protein [Corynebacterium urinipleomorphum]
MGRHSTGKNNYSLSKGLIALIAALALLLVAVTVFFMRDNDSDSDAASGGQPECVSGDLALPVAAANKKVGQQLIDAYVATNPVVRDYCVKPEYVDSLHDAAVYIAPFSPVAKEELSQAGRSAATNEPPTVYSTVVGVSGGSLSTDGGTPALSDVLFPTGEQPEASAIVADAIADSDDSAISALQEQRVTTVSEASASTQKVVATAQDSAPEGIAFAPLDGAELLYSAIPLTTTDDVTEEQSRAAQNFAEDAGTSFADSHGGNQKALSELSDGVWAAAVPEGGRRIPGSESASDTAGTSAGTDSNGSAPSEATNTLFLLDTSAAMSAFNDDAADAIDASVADLTSSGHSVALWNYSSPLTPGVTQGYRANISFTGNADDVAGTAHRFINDGEPLTREAVTAAVDYVESEATGEAPVRIVLITSGTADSSDDSAIQALTAARDKKISLTIVHVGQGGADRGLSEAAEFSTNVSAADELTGAIRAASGLA